MEIRCLIVDDEVLAQNVIEKYIESIPTLKLAGKCDNAIDAISFLHNNEVDLIFLDLNMPELNGLEMLKTLHNPPKVILTTAYSEYALESYEYGVIDYLLKPIKLERFIKAINKVVEQQEKNREDSENDISLNKTIFIKEDHITHAVSPQIIEYIEAFGNYLKIHTAGKTYITRLTMQNIIIQLPEPLFCRIHKSYIVNKKFINKVYGNIVSLNDIELPVGTTYKSNLLKSME
jgi:two-component system, LytTR family, response regulator